MSTVAVLFARADSNYKALPGVDVWDIERDARNWPGGSPVVAHPPCRAWGRLRQFSKATPEEKALAPYAVSCVRLFGGVLEHPAHSTLWAFCGMPRPGVGMDRWGGWTLEIAQCDFGHRAQKKTWLYICGASSTPAMPPASSATHCIRPTKSHPRLPSVTKAEREHTPPALAAWLVELAHCCR